MVPYNTVRNQEEAIVVFVVVVVWNDAWHDVVVGVVADVAVETIVVVVVMFHDVPIHLEELVLVTCFVTS
jgi:hypothetical protein